MIKINLARVRKERQEKAKIDVTALKGLKLQDIFKVGGEYYLGLLLWIGVMGMLGYYWNVNKQKNSLKTELDSLNAQKIKLQAQAKKFLEEKKRIEDNIARLNTAIQEIEQSKDIIKGLKAYYDIFNEGLLTYTNSLPKASWFASYKQSIDINQQKLSFEFEMNSFDYNSLSSYGKNISKHSEKILISPIERKVNQHGFEYYSAKFSTEKLLQGVQ